MSCDGNRHKYFEKAAAHKALQDTFGSAAEAQAALEQVFQIARAKAVTGDRGQMTQAEARTRKFFAEMRSVDLKPPTHSANGLPKRDAQFGYAAVQQTLESVRSGKPMPMLARQVLEKTKRTRQLSAVKQDAGGYMRCANCGRFASQSGGHACPATATTETLGKHLQRRLGINASAYGGGLQELLDSARSSGSVAMRHGLTGELVDVSLDGLPLALATGFAPESWKGKTKAVELPDSRVVTVLDAAGFNEVQPSSSATLSAGAAYGIALTPNTLVGNASSTPPMSYHSISESGETQVSGGQAYDLSHFIGTEYRKRDAQGVDIEVNGMTYTIGQRSQADWSSARVSGLEPEPKGGVAVGRTLVEAVGILTRGEVVETEDGKVQIYSADRRELLSMYDPATATAGDTLGTPNASSAQLAAVLAHRALHPQNQFDAALATDLLRVRQGKGTPLAAADSAYITMKNNALAGGKTIQLGGSLGASRCPNCGRFKGDAHVCPAQENGAATETRAPAFEAPSMTAQPASMNIDVQVDTTPIADALRETHAQQISIDQDAFANAMSQGMSNLNIPTPTITAALQSQDMSELKTAMTQMAQAIETLAKNPSSGHTQIPDRLVEVTEKLAANLSSTSIPMASVAQPVGSTPSKCPTCGQFMSADHICPPRTPRQGKPVTAAEKRTSQEHMVSSFTLPAPDPYLMNVPESVGGQLYQPLAEFIPEVDPNFEINSQGESILRSMSAMINAGANKGKSNWTRAFGLFGPAGTGKNTIARQLAASVQTVNEEGELSQGMNYVEANITPESSMQELIGTTVLEKDPESGSTVSRTKLGKIGLAAAMGSVVCINEIVRNPKLATALQSMVEDGEIQIDSPEQGMIRIPVHSSTVFVVTWNPGYEGDADRPGAAPLSRIMPFRLDHPSADEQARRVESFFAGMRGEKDAVASIEVRRAEILARDYSIPKDLTPSREEISTAVRFFNEVATLSGGGIGERQLGLNSDTSTAPGQRQLNRFIALGKAVGWNDALETLKIVCDQDDQFESQWSLVRERFEAHFGTDGNVFMRPAPEQN